MCIANTEKRQKALSNHHYLLQYLQTGIRYNIIYNFIGKKYRSYRLTFRLLCRKSIPDGLPFQTCPIKLDCTIL